MSSYGQNKRKVSNEILEWLSEDLKKERLKLLELIEKSEGSTLYDSAIATSVKRYVALSQSVRRLKEELTKK